MAQAVWILPTQLSGNPGWLRPLRRLLSRVDVPTLFHALDRSHIETIAKIQLKVLEARMEKMDMKLDVSPQALAELERLLGLPIQA